jgi:CHASE2 domain-containing sensor protein
MSKRKDPSLAFFSVAAAAAALVISPALIMHHHLLPLVPLTVWALIVATGVAQGVYFF